MADIKRAIVLAGGGPAVGLSLGALKRLEKEENITFDVWSCACIGAWVGILWNQAEPGQEYEETYAFMREVFRPDNYYARFPMATVFAPNWMDMIGSATSFIADPRSYRDLVVPEMIYEAWADLAQFAMSPGDWTEGNINHVIFNSLMAPNPVFRFASSLMYLSNLKGLSQIYYPNARVLKQINFENLYQKDRPYIYHNAYNLSGQDIELFSNNQKDPYQDISAASLCACSALPFIEAPVEINNNEYCEGATVDTVNFEDLLKNHPDLDEIWVSRILDVRQVRQPKNLLDALNNLVMLFAASVSEDDVRLFLQKVERLKREGRVKKSLKVYQLEVNHNIYYDWTYSNLESSIADGYRAAEKLVTAYKNGCSSHSEYVGRRLDADPNATDLAA